MSYVPFRWQSCQPVLVNESAKIGVLAVVTGAAVWLTLAGSGSSGAASALADGAARTGATSGSTPPATPAPASTQASPTNPSTTNPSPTNPSPTTPADASGVPDRDVADSALPVVAAGNGRLTVVPGGTSPSGPGRVQRYTVSVEGGLGVDAAQFAREVDRTLADPRSWGHAGAIAFQRVDHGPVEVQVVLASPATTDRMCRPLSTNGIYSCGNGPTAVINGMRWLRGADAYAGHLALYRQYVVNHEVGHTIGHGHQGCPAPGRLAPVMMQQTIGIGRCVASPWPFP